MSEEKSGTVAALEKTSDFIDRIGGYLCAGLFGAMTLVVIMGVFFRYVINAPLSWTEEVSRYLMIWGASVGISLGVRSEEHVGLTVILDAIKSRPVRLMFHTAIYILVMGFVGVMFYYSLADEHVHVHTLRGGTRRDAAEHHTAHDHVHPQVLPRRRKAQ